MKICFIGPGEINIPPTGWGAVETVIWNQYSELLKLGHEAHIVNEPTIQQAYDSIKKINPDIIHLHYGKYFELMPHFSCRKIVTNHDGSFLFSQKFHDQIVRLFLYDCEFFILTSWEYSFLYNIGISPKKINILPNGVDIEQIKFETLPQLPDKSICLGKIDERKNQPFLQNLNLNIDFVGQNTISEFQSSDSNYLGSWDREQVFKNLTNYSNLVLLSQSELHPLVCLEALAAGLGLVVSEAASQNLDSSLEFITIVDQKDIQNSSVVSKSIIENREICKKTDRTKIRNYAKKFGWENIAKQYIELL
jgi:glycosyltransferase involved in cell wall biosynthesis